jgi:hypothetical protein
MPHIHIGVQWFMAYVSEWERLSDVATRVMVEARLSQDEARSDICRAIADGAIKIRAKLERHTTRPYLRAWDKVLQGGDFVDLEKLKPECLDWERSRSHPANPWFVRRDQTAVVPGHWDVREIELWRTDLTNALCPAGAQSQSAHAASETGATGRNQPTRERALRALNALYRDRLPDQATVPNAILCGRVGEWLRQNGLPDVSDDTILRAADRRQ